MQEWPVDNSFASVRNWLLSRLQITQEELRERESWVRLLLEWQSGLNRAQLISGNYRFSESDLNRLSSAVARLAKGEPLQHITGIAWFYGRPFNVSKDVLIPRPETEELVKLTLNYMKAKSAKKILDIGTGSGCIAITLKLEQPHTHCEAWDVSKEALTTARFNAKALDATVEFKQRDILKADAPESFEVVVSNPPYITHTEVRELHERVRMHEPILALATPDDDPLLFYRKIIQLCFREDQPLLADRGYLWFECHENHTTKVAQLAEGYGSTLVFTDAQDKKRFVGVSKSNDR